MKQRIMYTLLFAAVAATILMISTPLRASEAEDKIESAFEKSYVYLMYPPAARTGRSRG